MNPQHGDRLVGALVRLAQESLTGEPSRREEPARFANLEQRIARTSPAPRSGRHWAMALACVAAIALSTALWSTLRPTVLTYSVVNGSELRGTVVGGADTRIRFSDGSEIVLDRAAETAVTDVGTHGGKVELKRGKLHVSIRKAPRAAWFVGAGPYAVQVTGTAFDVHWTEHEQLFEITLHSGSVLVTGPNARGGYRLRPGQRLLARAGAPMLVESTLSSPRHRDLRRDARMPFDAAAAAKLSAPSSTPEPASSAPAPAGTGPDAHSWRRLVAAGRFEEVIAAAESRGVAQILATASLEELSALADAARYARSTPLARRALNAQRERFPSSAAARDAAFFLGRLAESDGAIAWYDRYLAESPNGAYASQALGRKMMLIYERRGALAARGVALEYLRRYPDGAYAAAARKLEHETEAN